MSIIYTGIGSRNTPEKVIELFVKIAYRLALDLKGFKLRSGAADGSDSAFELGCDTGNGDKEIYLPWKDFNGNSSSLYYISKEAYELANKYHPAYEYQSIGVKKLLARDGYQVLGLDLQTPTSFIICYTEFGLKKGGTSQALRIAMDYQIPIYNAYDYYINNRLDEFYNIVIEMADKLQCTSNTNPIKPFRFI